MKIPSTTTKSKKPLRDLSPYSGKWIALVKREVKAVAQSLPALMEEVKKRNIAQKCSVMLVPRKDEGPYILFGKEQ